MNKPTVIAISGWKRSGKDTVADYLIKTKNAERIAFADPLKDLVSKLFGIYRTQIDSADSKEAPLLNMPVNPKDPFTRMIAEFMFKELRDEEGHTPNYFEADRNATFLGWFDLNNRPVTRQLYWTPRALCILMGSSLRTSDPDFWVKKAVAQTQPGGLYVISDCRYKNEVEALKRTGANVITIRVNRFETSPSNDPSERDLDNYTFDAMISNRGTLEDLYKSVDSVLEVLNGR